MLLMTFLEVSAVASLLEDAVILVAGEEEAHSMMKNQGERC
jgi:hypothetical protein